MQNHHFIISRVTSGFCWLFEVSLYKYICFILMYSFLIAVRKSWKYVKISHFHVVSEIYTIKTFDCNIMQIHCTIGKVDYEWIFNIEYDCMSKVLVFHVISYRGEELYNEVFYSQITCILAKVTFKYWFSIYNLWKHVNLLLFFLCDINASVFLSWN